MHIQDKSSNNFMNIYILNLNLEKNSSSFHWIDFPNYNFFPLEYSFYFQIFLFILIYFHKLKSNLNFNKIFGFFDCLIIQKLKLDLTLMRQLLCLSLLSLPQG